MARRFSQRKEISYEETLAPGSKIHFLQNYHGTCFHDEVDIHQMDVKTAFLNGVIEEEVYIEQPQGFEVEDRQTHVCKLKKALYGLKQDPRAWYGRMLLIERSKC